MNNIKSQILAHLEQKPNDNTLDLAKALNCPEGEIILNLPEQWVTALPGSESERILNDLPLWGSFTTIIEKAGSIFEIKGNFPTSIVGYGYFNLNMGPNADDSIALHGHLKLEEIAHIALCSKPFRGKESYCICFIAHNKEVVFKVYLGRDEKRRLFPDQIKRFNKLIQEAK